MSGRGSNWLLAKVRDAGVKVIIDLRTADHTDRYDRNVVELAWNTTVCPSTAGTRTCIRLLARFRCCSS